MKIAFVIGSLAGGGAERVVARLASQFSETGHNVTIYMIANDLIKYDVNKDVEIVFVKPSIPIRGIKYIERAFRLRMSINLCCPDVVISFTFGVSALVLFSLTGTNHRVIISERNNPHTDPSSPKLRKIRNLLYEKADGIVFQTQDAKSYFSETIQKKSAIIINPIGDDIPLPYVGDRESVLVSIGRLEPQKNHKLLIDAFAEVHKQFPDFVLKIYGEGSLKKQLHEHIVQLHLRENILLMGYSQNVLNDIRKATAFILSSDYEGISNALLEAMAIGLPVVSTDHPIGGARLLIENGKTGILIPVGDKDALVLSISQILSNGNLAQSMASNALNIRRLASIDTIANDWINFIETIL